jgi:hypothetical protein
MADVLGGLRAAIDAVRDADVAVLADAESIVELHRQLGRLEAVVTRSSAAFDAGGTWEADGARMAAAWLATQCRLPLPVAQRRVRLGRDLRHMPRVEAGWLAGDIGGAQATQLAMARTPATAACFARDEAELVEAGARLSYRHFVRVVSYWRQRADADGVEDLADRQHQARRLHLSESFDGAWFLDGVLDPISGAIVEGALKKIEKDLFESDWAEAKGRVGDGVCGSDLGRTSAQRRADALVEMARRAMATPVGARLPAPLFTVLVGYETFAGRISELANGSVVSPGSLVRWLDEAWVERVVFDSPDRIKNVGVRRRMFDGATRRAVEVRDRECFHDFCEITADDCEIDHVEPWATGGLTVDDNGRVACGFHNRLGNERGPPG